MTITQEQIDAIKADCEQAPYYGEISPEQYATLPAIDVLAIIERIEELEGAMKEILKIEAQSKSLLSAIYKVSKARDFASDALGMARTK